MSSAAMGMLIAGHTTATWAGSSDG
jgi:hypothetical protein